MYGLNDGDDLAAWVQIQFRDAIKRLPTEPEVEFIVAQIHATGTRQFITDLWSRQDAKVTS